MKKRFIMIICIVFLINGLTGSPALADSPVTSTPFSNAYLDIPMVSEARSTAGVITEEISIFLSSPDHSLDVKGAVINSMYNASEVWDVRDNAARFIQTIYQTQPDGLDLDSLSGEELLVIGYLTLMDDYFQPDRSLPFLDRAKKSKPDNFTIAMVHALALAQDQLFQSQWGPVWETGKQVVGNPLLKQDRFRPDAISIVLEYLYLYRNPRDDLSILMNRAFYITQPEPIILGGRAMVPWNQLFQEIGALVLWDASENQLVATYQDTTLTLKPDVSEVVVDGQTLVLDQPAVVTDGQLMVPLRFVCESFGALVHWNESDRSIQISI